MYKLSKYVTLVNSTLKNNQQIYLIYSGRTGKNLQVCVDTFEKVKEETFDKLGEKTFQTFIDFEVIVPKEEDEYDTIVTRNYEIQQRNLNPDFLYISLQPTANCQLGCYYCGQEHSNKKMDVQTIEWVIERVRYKLSDRHRTLRIGWFGGEPLMALDEMRVLQKGIDEIVNEKKLNYYAQIVTNGYALTPDVYKELVTDFKIRDIYLTLDGTAEYHDKRRCTKNQKPSFDIIYNNLLEMIKIRAQNKTPGCGLHVRINVDQNNYPGVPALLEKLEADNILRQVNVSISRVYSWAQNGADQTISFQEFAAKEIDFALENMKYGIQGNPLPGVVRQGCIATSCENEMYDAYGNIFDCSETSYTKVYENTPLVLGNLSYAKDQPVKRSPLYEVFKNYKNRKYEKCVECKLLPQCAPCPKTLYEEGRKCSLLEYNLKDKILLDYLFRRSNLKEIV